MLRLRLCTRFLNPPFQPYNLLHRLLLPYSTSPSTDYFTNHLVQTLDFSPQKASSVSKSLSGIRNNNKVNDFKFEASVVSFIAFLKTYGFDDTHIRKIVSLRPQVLCANVDDSLRPKLQLLQDQGLSKSDIIQVVYGNPKLLTSGVESSILPAFQVLRKVMGSNTLVIGILKQSWFNISSTEYLIPNVALLTTYGIPIELIRKHILLFPKAYMQKPEIFNDMVTRVKNKWGICPDSPVFLYGVHLASGYSEENIESKYGMFKSFGWSQIDIQTLMMKSPLCFTHSEAAIKKKLDYLITELRLEPGYLISNSCLFTYSLEKRIVPRHKILLFLKERGLLKNDPSLGMAVRMPEARFLKMFVQPFKEVHEVYAKLTGCSMKMLTQESSETCS